MKRRRHKLEVSTFPFLAVLLCAMGSLILVLLIMDRRAARAARYRVQQAAMRRNDEVTRRNAGILAENARRQKQAQAAWEEARRLLRDRLEKEKHQLQTRVQAVQQQKTAAATKVEEELAQLVLMRLALETEKSRLLGEQHILVQSQEQATALGQAKKDQKQTVLSAMSGELVRLEQTLKELQAARQRDSHTYSVIPYKGKSGESRRPIYIECARNVVVFHPEKISLNPDHDVAALRFEVERRIARQREQWAALKVAKDELPYLMLLVRPEGVGTYYHVQAALCGLEVQYGYELIDPDWLLDFPADDQAPEQSWMVSTSGPGNGPAKSMPSNGPRKTGTPRAGTDFVYGNQTPGGMGPPGYPGYGPPGSGDGSTGPGGPGNGPPGRGTQGTRNAASGSGAIGNNPSGRGTPGATATGPYPASNGLGAWNTGNPVSGSYPPGTGPLARANGQPGPWGNTTEVGPSQGIPGQGDGRPPGSGVVGRQLGTSGVPGSGIGQGVSGSQGSDVGNLQPIQPVLPGQPQGIPGQGDGTGTGPGGVGRQHGTHGVPDSGSGQGVSGSQGSGVGNMQPVQPVLPGQPGQQGQPGQSGTFGQLGQQGGLAGGEGSSNGNVDGFLPRGPSGGTRASGPAIQPGKTGNPGQIAAGNWSGNAAGNVGGQPGTDPGNNPAPNTGGNPGAAGPSSSPAGQGTGSGDGSSAVGTGSQVVGGSLSGSSGQSGGPGGDPNSRGGQGSGGSPEPGSSGPAGDEPGLPGKAARAIGTPVTLPIPLKKPTRRPPVLRPAQISGDRDWVIFVECQNNGLIVYPSRQVIPLSAITRDPNTNQLLLLLQLMIARRQASVRPGELPYRPQVRFLLRPECERTYHMVYPTLETLGAPIFRQTLEPEDDVLRIVAEG